MSTPILRRTLLTTAAGTALVIAAISAAATPSPSLARVDIYDRNARQTLPVYHHRGRSYVAGQPGNEYAVRIRNCSGRRMLAVVSVDGVNVITGQTASPDQSGYVVEPGDYVNIQGWQKDLERSAAFYFTDPGDSYAARTGRPRDLGVIGVALFLEAERDEQPWMTFNDSAGKSAERSAAAAPSAPEPSLGTGHGRSERAPVERVAFERASARPDEIIRIRYERRETLAALGILPMPPRWPVPRDPDAFPGAMSFVPDP
jgi:hypothetical protein